MYCEKFAIGSIIIKLKHFMYYIKILGFINVILKLIL